MKKISNIKKLFIVCLFLIEMCSLFLTYKSYGNRIFDVEDIKEEYKVDKETFSMYIETKDNEGNISYEEYNESGIFPTGYKINLEKSNCTDTKGNLINGILSGRGNKVTVTSNKTAYCYVYFDIDYTLSELCESGDNLGSCLTTNNEEIDSLGDTAYSEMYRYTGTDLDVDDNYICFGTADKNTCVNNPDKYMYRVIGITSESNSTLGLDVNQLKLIKHTSIGTHEWHSDYTTDTKWESSTMYTYLQNDVLNNTTYYPSGWSNKIDNIKWNIGDVKTTTDGETVYESERSIQTTNVSKIGLGYLSDYYYAYIKGGETDCYNNKCINWMRDQENHTWLMTRYGYNTENNDYRTFYIHKDGRIIRPYPTNTNGIRPVFYLNVNEQYISGDGTLDNPIMLADKEAPEGNSVVINNNDIYAISTSVTLTLTSTGASEMCISESETCTNWEEYKTSKSYTLTNTLGEKTIYVKYRDEAGNITSAVTDKISLYEQISTMPSQSSTLTYTRSAQSPTWSNYDNNKLTIGGTTSGTNAGSYNATFTPKTNYIWSDGTTTAKTVSWSIGRATISIVPSQSGTLTYTGSSQTPSWSNYDSNKMALGGTKSGTNSGSYNATFTPTSNYQWSDGSTTAKTVSWKIGKKANTLTLSANSGSVTYGSNKTFTISTNTSGGTLSVTSSDTSVATVSISGTTVTITSKKVGSSTITVTSAATTNYNSASKTYTITVNRASLTVPSQSGTLTYTGSSQSPSWSNYDSNKLTIGGTTSGTNAGSYNATFTPKANYQWSDGSTTAKTVSWSIGKAVGSLSVSPTTLSIQNGSTGTITATRSGNGTVSATSSDTSVATVSVSGTTITVTGKSAGSATITVSVAAGTNHTAPSNKTVSVTVSNPIGTYIQNLKPTGYNTTAEAGLYRFQGTTADNHICFGTSDKATCTGNTDAYMYRIIGINSSGQLKLIKKEALNTGYFWYHLYESNLPWNDSHLFKGLNGISGGNYSNLFIGNSTYMPSGWSDKIADTSWKYGMTSSVTDMTVSWILSKEASWSNSVKAKIGLMYLSDYSYGLNGGTHCTHTSSVYTTCKTSWIHLSNNDAKPPHPTEWTMVFMGNYLGTYFSAWSVQQSGMLSHSIGINNLISVRPVFYLNSDVVYKSGTGTSTDPFIIE